MRSRRKEDSGVGRGRQREAKNKVMQLESPVAGKAMEKLERSNKSPRTSGESQTLLAAAGCPREGMRGLKSPHLWYFCYESAWKSVPPFKETINGIQ